MTSKTTTVIAVIGYAIDPLKHTEGLKERYLLRQLRQDSKQIMN